jgi:hypothetical protein
VGGDPVGFIDPLGLAPDDIFPTPDATAIDAARFVFVHNNKLSKNFEFGGWIFPVEGGYSYNIVKSDSRDSVPFRLKARLKEQCPAPPIATWHTHPNVPDERLEDFSEGDVDVAKYYRMPSYLGTPFYTVKKFVPSTGRQSTVGTWR